MALYAGVDCGTQSTKVLIIDSDSAQILGQGSAPHQLINEANGRREQLANWWTEALEESFKQALINAQISGSEIVALAVSGQQHGFVPLDIEGNVLTPVKLWCDTESADENEEIIDLLGGKSKAMSQLGILPQTGYTLSKILWFKKNHPEKWKKLNSVLLPHDYLNYWLTGCLVAEYGDASGTGLLNVKCKEWDKYTADKIDPEGRLWNALPKLVKANSFIGTIKPNIAKKLGLSTQTKVSSGGGDNMMAAIGTGNIKPGITTMSLGTSGTLFTYTDTPIKTSNEMIANFCSSNNGWLPLICTMNVTSATTKIRQLFNLDIEAFNEALQLSPPGAEGVMMLPFFNGERVPPLPHAQASLHCLNHENLTPQNLSMAVVESATYGLKFGLDLFREQGLSMNEIRLTGGGSRSPVWRQIVADITNTQVVCVANEEGAALGAALQSIWCDYLDKGKGNINPELCLSDICNKFVHLNENTRMYPDPARVNIYQDLYSEYIKLLKFEHPKVNI